MTAAEIAARRSMLATLEAARIVMRDTVNPASTTLNAAILRGDMALLPIVETLSAVVVALNAYRPKLLAEIAATDAMVPTDAAAPVFLSQPSPVPVVFTQGVAAERIVNYAVDKGAVALEGALPPGVTATVEAGPGQVRYKYDGAGAEGSTTNEIEAT